MIIKKRLVITLNTGELKTPIKINKDYKIIIKGAPGWHN